LVSLYQIVSIQVSANPYPPGKWPLKHLQNVHHFKTMNCGTSVAYITVSFTMIFCQYFSSIWLRYGLFLQHIVDELINTDTMLFVCTVWTLQYCNTS